MIVLRLRNQFLSAILGLACAGVALAQTGASSVLRVRANDHETVLTAADIGALPRRQVRVADENSSDSSTVVGPTLWEVLQKAGVPSPEASGRQRAATYVRLTGSDGQTAMFALVELDPGFSRRTVVVADRRNGRALDASEGPWRVFVPDDLRHARWVRGVIRIDVGTLPP
jgi:hypothetical protein